MGLKSSSSVVVGAGMIETIPQLIAIDPETKRVRGQVRMHAIIAGYMAAAQLVATLNNSPAAIREDLHTLAKEVADKVEEYSFK